MRYRNNITLEQLRNSACAKRNPHLFQEEPKTGGRKVAKHFEKRGNKEKDWMGWNLLYWCNEHAVVLEEEFKFHPYRKWKFDWCIPALKIAIEYEGILSDKSRHTTVTGFTADTEKYNAAQQRGWILLRFTALNYKTLMQQLNKYA